MNLSPNFTLEELTLSQSASRLSLDNTPPPTVLAKLANTAKQLELVRTLLVQPINISSGYRSPEVNKSVGGAAKSQHLSGEAVDFTAPKFGTPRQIVEKIKSSNIQFSQLILEFDRWVHISFDSTNKRQVLTINSNGTSIFA